MITYMITFSYLFFRNQIKNRCVQFFVWMSKEPDQTWTWKKNNYLMHEILFLIKHKLHRRHRKNHTLAPPPQKNIWLYPQDTQVKYTRVKACLISFFSSNKFFPFLSFFTCFCNGLALPFNTSSFLWLSRINVT